MGNGGQMLWEALGRRRRDTMRWEVGCDSRLGRCLRGEREIIRER
jgi:hypothetical protein